MRADWYKVRVLYRHFECLQSPIELELQVSKRRIARTPAMPNVFLALLLLHGQLSPSELTRESPSRTDRRRAFERNMVSASRHLKLTPF
jgi:hypothetical protein